MRKPEARDRREGKHKDQSLSKAVSGWGCVWVVSSESRPQRGRWVIVGEFDLWDCRQRCDGRGCEPKLWCQAVEQKLAQGKERVAVRSAVVRRRWLWRTSGSGIESQA